MSAWKKRSAVSGQRSAGLREMVRLGEIANFLGQDREEVKMFVEVDGLPHSRIPGKTRPAVRVALRDLHRFFLKRMAGETVLRDFEEFRRAFWESQGRADGTSALPGEEVAA